MIDLVCLLADKSIEATLVGILGRPSALAIRPVEIETVVHPRRDPGCFHEAGKLLAGFTSRARHALVVLDRAWEGAPSVPGIELEQQLEGSLRALTPAGWARAVVIEPELEAWVFSSSPHVATAIGWPESTAHLRATLEDHGLWTRDQAKPGDPKATLDWVLRTVKRPRSSAIYRTLARTVSLRRCEDPSFLRLTGVLRGWFGVEPSRRESTSQG